MTQLNFDRVRDLFLAARDLDVAARGEVLHRECGDDPTLRLEVESLLAHHDRQQARMTMPVVSGGALESVLKATTQAEEALPRPFGEFELLEIVGRGGMGTVYRAVQRTPERIVALKVIRPGMMTPAMLERFRYEADLLARLQHPGIAQIFEAGTVQSGGVRQPYFAMEFIAGQPIDVAIAERDLNVGERLAMMVKVCEAVHHAHQKGVIHRDLKPANILVETPESDEETARRRDDGEASSSLEPSSLRHSVASSLPSIKILDFGVARATDADVRATMLQTGVGQLIGTLPYMSPEQVTGDPRRLDIRSDVYALGVLMFEVLTGKLPYELQEKTIADAALTIREKQPLRLSAISPTLRGDLDTIIGKALEKDASRRYESAAALADDLRRYLAYRPIVARPPSALYQMRLFARRHRALVAGSALAIAALVLAAGLSLGFAVRSQRAAEAEAKQRIIAQRTSDHLKTILTFADPHRQGADMTVGEMLERIVQRLDSQSEMPEVEAEVRTAIGTTYLNLRQSQRAVEQLTRAVDLWREIEPGGANLGHALVPLGVARLHINDYDGSEAAYREAVAILDQLGESNLERLRGGLVDMLIRRQKYHEADPIAYALLAAARQETDPVILIGRLRPMARIHVGMGAYDQAQRELEEALALGQRHLSETNPLYYNVLLDMNRLRHALGDLAGALDASTQAYTLSRAATPGSNDWTACLMAHLAALEMLDRREEMRQVLTDARATLEKTLAPDHALMRQIDGQLTRLGDRQP